MKYVKEIKMRGVKAANRALEDFKPEDWLFDTNARTWTHSGRNVILLDRNESSTRHVLLNKIML